MSSILKSAQETRGQDIPKQHIPRKPRKCSELGRSVSILAGPSQFMKGFVYRLRSLGFIPKIKENHRRMTCSDMPSHSPNTTQHS